MVFVAEKLILDWKTDWNKYFSQLSFVFFFDFLSYGYINTEFSREMYCIFLIK